MPPPKASKPSSRLNGTSKKKSKLPSKKKSTLISKKKPKMTDEEMLILFKTLHKVSGEVVERTRVFDLDIPIYKIAYLDLRKKFNDRRLDELRKIIYFLLERSNGFRRDLWEFIKTVRLYYDQEMIKDGSYSPDLPQYETLKNDIHSAILAHEREVWATRYDSNLEKIRIRSQKTEMEPRDGGEMFDDLAEMVEDRIQTLREGQKQVMEDFSRFQDDLTRIMDDPKGIKKPHFTIVYQSDRKI